MPITPFLAGRTFEPEQITVMSAAFADTCKALGLSEANHPLTPLVAQHVMGLGQRGVKSRTVFTCSRLNSLDYTGSNSETLAHHEAFCRSSEPCDDSEDRWR
jgi:hypothetical protein